MYSRSKVDVSDGYIFNREDGHVCWRWKGDTIGKWSVNIYGYPFNFKCEAVVDDFGSLVRVKG